MSETPPPETHDGEDLVAAEYALGVLDPEDRAAAEARAEHDEVFAADILAWVVRLEPLIDEVRSVEPSAPLWPRIEAAISRPKAQAALALPTALPTPANDSGAGSKLWRAWAVGASAVAAAAVLFIAVRPALHLATPGSRLASGFASNGAQGGKTLIATLSLNESKASAFTVAYDPAQGTLYATPAADFSLPRARSAELWLIPADGKPRPMGVVDATKAASIPMPAQFKALARSEATLAISVEPQGGSTTGLPTGPVVATGKFAAI